MVGLIEASKGVHELYQNTDVHQSSQKNDSKAITESDPAAAVSKLFLPSRLFHFKVVTINLSFYLMC